MLDRLLAHLAVAPPATADTVGDPFPRRELAIAVLLLEVAQCDGAVTQGELAAITALMRERLGLDEARAAALLDAARRELDASLEDWIFAAHVRAAFGGADRTAIVAAMWRLVYADGRLTRLEDAMLAHVAEQLDVPRPASEAARAQACANAPPPHERDRCRGER